MIFDANNKIIKLCADGMSLEGEGKTGEAADLFMQAWNEAENDFEKFTAAHYVARHQNTMTDKLKWDETALFHAEKIKDESLKTTYPSLYLNIAKCYEDMNDWEKAKTNYQLAQSYTNLLPQDGYGQMIRSGIINGLQRIKDK
jgi:rifampin ADP-ribosylating transferase